MLHLKKIRLSLTFSFRAFICSLCERNESTQCIVFWESRMAEKLAEKPIEMMEKNTEKNIIIIKTHI